MTSDNGQSIPEGTISSFDFTPDDNGTYTVTLTVTDLDDGGQQYIETVEVVVANVTPVVDLGGDLVVDEGDGLVFANPVIDAAGDTHTFAWELVFPDGSTLLIGTDPTLVIATIDDEVNTVRVTVTDDDGAQATDEVLGIAQNVAPENVSAGSDQTVDEGLPVSLTASFTDPGTQDTHTFLWQVVTDSDGEVGSAQVQVTANNLVPTADAGGPYSVGEGSPLIVTGTASDRGSGDLLTFSWDINGDGTFGDATGPSPTLTWAELNAVGIVDGPSTFNVFVRVGDGDGGVTTSAVALLTVNNVAPQDVQIALDQPAGIPVEGTQIVLAGTYVDPGVGEPLTYAWDAISSNGQQVASQAGAVPPTGQIPPFSFIPNNNGVYWVGLTVDDGTDSTTAFSTIGVDNVVPTVIVNGGNRVSVGTAFALSGSFTDPGSDVWSATVTVANGPTTVSLPLPLGDQSKSFDTSYVFADPGSYDVTVTLQDGDAMTSATITVEVTPEGMAPLLGDLDIDGDVDFDDIAAFVLGLTNPVQYEEIYGVPPTVHGDIDMDGDQDFDDIARLIQILTNPVVEASTQADDFALGLTDSNAFFLQHGFRPELYGDTDLDGDLDFDDIRGYVEMLSETYQLDGVRAIGGSGDVDSSNAADVALTAVDSWVTVRHAANDLALARRPFRPDVALARAGRPSSEFEAASQTGRREALLEAVANPVSTRTVSEYRRAAD